MLYFARSVCLARLSFSLHCKFLVDQGFKVGDGGVGNGQMEEDKKGMQMEGGVA